MVCRWLGSGSVEADEILLVVLPILFYTRRALADDQSCSPSVGTLTIVHLSPPSPLSCNMPMPYTSHSETNPRNCHAPQGSSLHLSGLGLSAVNQ